MTLQAQDMKPPIAQKIPKELDMHNHKRIDNYFWLNQRENTEVTNHLKAENLYTEAMMKHTEPLQENLYHEIVGRIKQTDMSVPYFENGFYYYTRYEEGQEYPIFCRKKGNLEAEEHIMLNVNELAEGHNFFEVAGLSVSDDNHLLAFATDTIGRRKYTIHFKDLRTGKILEEQIPLTGGSMVWSADNKTLFYVVKDETTLREYKILKHILGTHSQDDQEIFHEKDETYSTFVFRTKSKKYIMIGSYNTLSTEFRFVEADKPHEPFTLVLPREPKHEYGVEHFENHFYIVSNWQAKNFRLFKTSIHQTDKQHWKEIIPHREHILLESIEVFKDFLVLKERKQGLDAIRIIPWGTLTNNHTKDYLKKNSDFEKNKTHLNKAQEKSTPVSKHDPLEKIEMDNFQTNEVGYYIDFGEATYSAWISVNRTFDAQVLRFGYNSLTTPVSTFEYDMSLKTKTLLKQQEVLGDFKTQNYHSERLYAIAPDGVVVPISVVYKKGLKKDGNHPLLLEGYGSYGMNYDPDFSSARLSLLDRGFVIAIAHIRGGEEMGRYWYDDGKMFKKKNTFTDFIACAEYLIQQKFTNPDKLFAEGGSAGGLLMGAVINMRSDLFKGIVAAVPFVDIVTTMLDETIPLTTGEYDEWGNPNHEDAYQYMLSYSPYDNIKAQSYPHILVTTSLHDSQVQYWEPAKWVAKLREMKTDNHLLLLKTDMEAGHGGKSGRFKRYKDTAFEYAFLLNLLGIQE
jgi:oligopeptidase B